MRFWRKREQTPPAEPADIQADDVVFVGGIVWGEGRVSFVTDNGVAAVILNSGAVFARASDLELRHRPA